MKKRVSLIYVFLIFVLSLLIINNANNTQLEVSYLIYFVTIHISILYIYHINYDLMNLILPINVLLYFYLFFIFGGVILSTIYIDIIVVTNKLVCYLTACFVVIILAILTTDILKKQMFLSDVVSAKLIVKNTKYIPNGKLFIYVGFMLFAIYYLSVGNIPLLVSGADDFRVEALKGKGYIFLVGYAFIFNGLVFNFFCNFKRGKLRESYLLFILSIIIILGSGYRGNAFKILLLLIVLYVFSKYKRIKVVKTSILILILFSLVAIVGFFRSSGQVNITLDIIVRVTLWRFFVNIYNLQNISNYVLYNSILMGKTYIMDLKTLLPGYQMSSSNYMKNVLGLKFTGGGITPTIFGESLINFGVFYGTICIFLVFVAVKALQNHYMKKIHLNQRFLSLHLIIVIAYSIDPLIGSGIMPMILFSLLPMLLIRWIMIIYYYNFKIHK